MNKLACLLPFAIALVACGSPEQTPPGESSAAPAAVDQPAEPAPPRSAAELAEGKLDDAIAGEWRSAENRARDQYRHPKETLEFFDVTPDQTLIEITPGAGWYTEILAPLLKGSGTYIAALFVDSSSDYAKKNNDKYRDLLKADAAAFGDVKVIEMDPKTPNLGAPGSADTVLTFRNVHNWAGSGNAPAMFKAFFDVLKPGGVLGVVDHRASASAPADKIGDSGYLPQDYVIKLATDAGFRLAGQSDINANPKDTKDYEKGVWTLPPTLRLGDTDRDKYLAIGESDRMTLKFVKPKADTIFQQEEPAPEPAKG